MSKKPKIVASGGLVMREYKGNQQVLLIHRPRYRDWSLPKGKGKADELHPETAVREIYEETGVRATLGLRLPSVKYPVSKGTKVCHYWRAAVDSHDEFEPNAEVDKIKWVDVDAARDMLSYPDELPVLDAAVATPASTALLLVRHGKAMLRKNWTGADHKRRLASRGRAQAEALRGLLAAFGVERTVSSSAVRCIETLAPYAEQAGLRLEGVDVLTEEEGAKRPKRVVRFMDDLRHEIDLPTAVCGHRPVLPSMFEGLGLEPRPMVVGEGIAIHLGTDGTVLKQDVFKPTA